MLRNPQRVVGHRVVDDRLSAYETFFDEKWARRVAAITDGTGLKRPVDDLVLSWRAAAETSRLPWLMMQLMKSAIGGYVDGDNFDWVKGLRLFSARVVDTCGVSDAKFIECLGKAADEIAGEIKVHLPGRSLFDPEETFHSLVHFKGFVGLQLALSSSQQLVYSAIYFGYEDFALACCRKLSGDVDLRFGTRNGERMKDVLAEYLGQEIADNCCAEEAIDTARLVRNAIAHYGGRVTPQLRNKSLDIPTDKGRLHVMPEHNKKLFNLLKARAIKMAKASVEKIENVIDE